MPKRKKTLKQVTTAAVKMLPPGIEKFSKDPTFNQLDNIFPGDEFSDLRRNLLTEGIAGYGDTKITADFKDGKVMAIAAAVPRRPVDSEQWLKDNVPDFSSFGTNANDPGTRTTKIQLFYKIARQEGIV